MANNQFFADVKRQTELKGKAKARLQREGRWKEFVKFREDMRKNSGLPGWLVAICALSRQEFAPLDGTATEFTADEYHARLERFRGTAQKQEAAAAASGGAASSETVDKAVSGMRLAGAAAINKGRINQVEELKWMRLRRRVALAKRKGRSRAADDEASIVRWVYNNAESHVDDIDPLDVPCVGAIKHLRRVQESTDAYDELTKTLWSKLLAKNLESGEVSGPGDDGRKQLRALDKIMQVDLDADEKEIAAVLRGDATEEVVDDDDDEEAAWEAELEELEREYADPQATVSRAGTSAQGSQEEHRVPSPDLESGAGI